MVQWIFGEFLHSDNKYYVICSCNTELQIEVLSDLMFLSLPKLLQISVENYVLQCKELWLVWLGLSTEITWLDLGKDHSLA